MFAGCYIFRKNIMYLLEEVWDGEIHWRVGRKSRIFIVVGQKTIQRNNRSANPHGNLLNPQEAGICLIILCSLWKNSEQWRTKEECISVT